MENTLPAGRRTNDKLLPKYGDLTLGTLKDWVCTLPLRPRIRSRHASHSSHEACHSATVAPVECNIPFRRKRVLSEQVRAALKDITNSSPPASAPGSPTKKVKADTCPPKSTSSPTKRIVPKQCKGYPSDLRAGVPLVGLDQAQPNSSSQLAMRNNDTPRSSPTAITPEEADEYQIPLETPNPDIDYGDSGDGTFWATIASRQRRPGASFEEASEDESTLSHDKEDKQTSLVKPSHDLQLDPPDFKISRDDFDDIDLVPLPLFCSPSPIPGPSPPRSSFTFESNMPKTSRSVARVDFSKWPSEWLMLEEWDEHVTEPRPESPWILEPPSPRVLALMTPPSPTLYGRSESEEIVSDVGESDGGLLHVAKHGEKGHRCDSALGLSEER